MANKRPEIQQIGDCIEELAKRCVELGDETTASILYCVVGSISENTTRELSDITVKYAMLQLLKGLGNFKEKSPENNNENKA